MWTREQLIEDLKTSEMYIDFVKTNGETRVMKCTLQESMIKPYERKTEREKKIIANNLSVWDLEKQDWRTIRIDSINRVYK
jgi:hypothetical protein